MNIRPEQQGDQSQIRRINQLAFDGNAEANLVSALSPPAGFTANLSMTPDEIFMLKKLQSNALQDIEGMVQYHPLFQPV